METGIVMQNPTQVMQYAIGFMFVIISLTVACYASIMTLIGLVMDWEKVKWIDVSFLLTGFTLVLIAQYGAPGFIGTFHMPTGILTWGVANTVWFLYDAMMSD